MPKVPGHDYGGTRYEKDLKGFQELMCGKEMAAYAKLKAGEAMAYARKISPPPYHRDIGKSSKANRASKERAGRYKERFEVSGPYVRNLTKKYPSQRASYDVVNTSPYALEVEIGWKFRGTRFQWRTAGMAGEAARQAAVSTPGYHVLGLTRTFIGDPIEPTNEL